jgi:2-isopropylmalate synthase
MQMKLRMTPDEVLAQAVKAVGWARQYADDIEFSPEDAGRSEPDFLCRLIEAVIAAGATTVNIPDTVGYTMPWQFGALIKSLRERIPNSDRAVWSVHCHNDLGVAVANSLAAVMNGARQVECTVNGLGERAGNASLEEIVMAVKTRKDVFSCTTRIDTTQILAASKLVSGITGFPVQPNKAIVGANAFAHESGIHQYGVLKHRDLQTAAEDGLERQQLLGKLSGRNAFKTRLTELGIDLGSDAAFNAAFAKFKELADKKGQVFDEDLQALVSDEALTPEHEHYRLATMKVVSETGAVPHARVAMTAGGARLQADASGDGPVDAVFKAIEQMAPSRAKLLLYSVNAITTGTDAQGEVTVRLERDGRIVNGNGADTDIIRASAKAYLNARTARKRLNPQLAV